jgi:hypothetical protein
MALPYLACMLATAHFYHLPPRALPSIHAVEGGFPGAIHPNKNGTDDLGVMQINTAWVQPLTSYISAVTHGPMSGAETYRRLVNDACFNVAAAGLILRTEWQQGGHDWLTAVGNYHSHTPLLHQIYLAKVTAQARVLFGG